MKTCIVDERISEKCERGLEKAGFKVITLPPSPDLSDAVKSHTDMLIFCHNGNIISSADYCEQFPYVFSDIREFSQKTSFTFTADKHKSQYPYDAIFNALVIGNMIFLKKDTVSKGILDYALKAGLEIVDTKQGYPACTVLAFENRAITADKGMAKLLREKNIEVTEITNGKIALPPYEYGFIGGAAGVYNKCVYFLGDIKTHPDSDIIISAVESANYTPVSLSDEPLFDLGKIIFVD